MNKEQFEIPIKELVKYAKKNEGIKEVTDLINKHSKIK